LDHTISPFLLKSKPTIDWSPQNIGRDSNSRNKLFSSQGVELVRFENWRWNTLSSQRIVLGFCNFYWKIVIMSHRRKWNMWQKTYTAERDLFEAFSFKWQKKGSFSRVVDAFFTSILLFCDCYAENTVTCFCFQTNEFPSSKTLVWSRFCFVAS